jgi:hypothetical protein
LTSESWQRDADQFGGSSQFGTIQAELDGKHIFRTFFSNKVGIMAGPACITVKIGTAFAP